MAERKKPVRRSTEERIADIDAKIASHEKSIENLKAKKDAILNPKPRISKATQIKNIVAKAKDSGMSVEVISERLGIEL